MYQSLHNHTLISDGSQTHLELLGSAESLGYSVIAFTDHDQLPDQKHLKQLRGYRGPVTWITGIEISARIPSDHPREGILHVLGLFIDPTYKPLIDYCTMMRENRVLRMQHFVKELSRAGFKISEKDCYETAGESMIGSPHIVKAVRRHRQNQELEEKLIKQMKQKARTDQEIAAQYERMIKEGPNSYPYVLYMKRHSFIPMSKSPTFDTLPDLNECVSLIRKAGGFSSLAHWWYEKHAFPKEELLKVIKAGGLDGLEVDAANAINERDHRKEGRYLRWLGTRFNLAKTIGADAHGHDDLAYYVNSPVGKKSVGLTESIVKQFKPPLKWTNMR